MDSTAYEKVGLDLLHPGRPVLVYPLCLHLQGQTQLVVQACVQGPWEDGKPLPRPRL